MLSLFNNFLTFYGICFRNNHLLVIILKCRQISSWILTPAYHSVISPFYPQTKTENQACIEIDAHKIKAAYTIPEYIKKPYPQRLFYIRQANGICL